MSTQVVKSTKEVANRLVELCRKGQIVEAQEELHADNVVANEPVQSPFKGATGKKAVAEKGKLFAQSIEERHSGSFSDPLVNGRFFSMAMTLDATFKGMGRMTLEEICTYEVKDGKIVAETFFY